MTCRPTGRPASLSPTGSTTGQGAHAGQRRPRGRICRAASRSRSARRPIQAEPQLHTGSPQQCDDARPLPGQPASLVVGHSPSRTEPERRPPTERRSRRSRPKKHRSRVRHVVAARSWGWRTEGNSDQYWRAVRLQHDLSIRPYHFRRERSTSCIWWNYSLSVRSHPRWRRGRRDIDSMSHWTKYQAKWSESEGHYLGPPVRPTRSTRSTRSTSKHQQVLSYPGR